jgi:hypothetical protein
MKQRTSLKEQIEENLPKVHSRPEFADDHGWLTFYLCGPSDDLRRLSHALDGQGWVNTGDWDGGFIYQKIKAERTAAAILTLAIATQALCGAYGITIVGIDADTSSDVRHSHVEVLYNAPR